MVGAACWPSSVTCSPSPHFPPLGDTAQQQCTLAPDLHVRGKKDKSYLATVKTTDWFTNHHTGFYLVLGEEDLNIKYAWLCRGWVWERNEPPPALSMKILQMVHRDL